MNGLFAEERGNWVGEIDGNQKVKFGLYHN